MTELRTEITRELANACSRLPNMNTMQVLDFICMNHVSPYERNTFGHKRNVDPIYKMSDAALLKALKQYNKMTAPKPVPYVTNGKILLTAKEIEALAQMALEFPHEGVYTLKISNKSGVGQATVVETWSGDFRDITDYDKF